MLTKIFKPASSINKLYVISTPIGNLSEINERAMKAFSECSVWYCEDTRVSVKLVNHLNLTAKKLISYREHNENAMLDKVLETISNGSAILISDAGYPCISDPGYKLVNHLIDKGIAVEVINGSSSIMHAIVASGINCERFTFFGFLAAKSSQKSNEINSIMRSEVPVIMFESPNRVKETLEMIHNTNLEYDIAVCKELTKLNETIYRTSNINEIIDNISEKGEYVIVIKPLINKVLAYTNKDLIDEVNHMVKNNSYRVKDACKMVAEKYHLTSSYVYKIIVEQE
jgi:16S rRNA (cytidine1402-2'-O)-methyltransferase